MAKQCMHRIVLSLALTVTLSAAAPGESPPAFTMGHDGPMTLVSPLFGWNRNELIVRGRGGETVQTDTAPQTGLFTLFAQPRLVVNNFLFYTDPNQTDVWGNLLFVNGHGPETARLTWNLGAGHLYHKIESDRTDIEVSVPMLKAGGLWRFGGQRLSLNPYLSYAWESVETDFSDEEDESLLYGLTFRAHWRMLHGTLKYYYQDVLDGGGHYHVFRARAYGFLDRNWALAARFEYMEHSTSTDTSFLFGPAYMF
mgnify:CR=1 FL=1